jgi:hypothetical protein
LRDRSSCSRTHNATPRGGIHDPVEAFTAGRTPAKIAPPYEGDGQLLAGQLCDDAELAKPSYANSTFANVSFLRAKVLRGTFRNCVFIECYFRKADLRESSFVGCKFIECNFTHVTIRDCDFRYAEFRGIHPPFSELEHSAPQQANLRYELFSRLAAVAETAGDLHDSRRYRVAAIDAPDNHLRAAVRAESTWYREHFDALARAAALVRLLWHKLNNVLWAHGESAWRLLLSALSLALVAFPVLFILLKSGLADADEKVGSADYLWLSLSNFLLLDRVSSVVLTAWYTRSLSALEALLGVIFAGMYVTLLVKALLRR